MKTNVAYVILNAQIPQKPPLWWKQFSVVIAPSTLQDHIERCGCVWKNLNDFVEPGSVHEASEFAEELSRTLLRDGTSVVKSDLYKGYELWWIHYSHIFLHFCLPYTQYKKLLAYLTGFTHVYTSESPYNDLFRLYVTAHAGSFTIVHTRTFLSRMRLPYGVLMQMILTCVSLPILLLRRSSVLVFTGDKFEPGKDYDARMKCIYEALRQRKMRFVECIRSLESAKKVFQHALYRRRPVLYSEALALFGMWVSFVVGDHTRSMNRYAPNQSARTVNPIARFKINIATHYLRFAGDDIWGIRINTFILRLIGVRAASITAANDRNFQTVLGCKISGIPTVGILPGAASRYYNMNDFMPAFTGEKMLSADRYGLWSAWWKEYYLKYSRAYREDQLYVSGPMRPVSQKNIPTADTDTHKGRQRVLLVSEIVAEPLEVMPYLDALLTANEFSVHIKFRPVGDSFEAWLTLHRPDVLETIGSAGILKGKMDDAIAQTDIAVGSQSTGVIEAVLQNKPFVFFNTQKWGDYYSLRSVSATYTLFAETPEAFIACVRNAKDIPEHVFRDLREKFFGDPSRNGSEWVVDQLELLRKR